MENKLDYFITDNRIKLPVNLDRYLFPAIPFTSPGTKYWQPPPSEIISEKQIGRVVLQLHQIYDIFKRLNIDLNNKSFLDIGTGNGMIPKLLACSSNIKNSVGIDPFLDGEHSTSWQQHNRDELFTKIKNYIFDKLNGELDFNKYSKLTNEENISFIPETFNLKKQNDLKFQSHLLDVLEIEKLNQKFDIIYCKALEHISSWEKVFEKINSVSQNDTIIYFKHRSFFSYLGAHRYGSLGIPWGHLLLNENEYKRFVEKFHPERSEEMCRFFFKDLAYPRSNISDLLRISNYYGFCLKGIKIDPLRYISKISPFISDIPEFWDLIYHNYPNINIQEMFGGIMHVVLKKI